MSLGADGLVDGTVTISLPRVETDSVTDGKLGGFIYSGINAGLPKPTGNGSTGHGGNLEVFSANADRLLQGRRALIGAMMMIWLYHVG